MGYPAMQYWHGSNYIEIGVQIPRNKIPEIIQ